MLHRILDDQAVDARRRAAPSTRLADASKPTNFTLPAQPLSWSTRSVANVVDSFGAKMPSTPRLPSGFL